MIPTRIINRTTGLPPTEQEWERIKDRATEIFRSLYASPEQMEWAIDMYPEGFAEAFEFRTTDYHLGHSKRRNMIMNIGKVDKNGWRIFDKCSFCGQKQALYAITASGAVYAIVDRIRSDKSACQKCVDMGRCKPDYKAPEIVIIL